MARESARSPRAATMLSLPVSHWKQFHDVRRPGRPDARIDHVLVGPSGVYVIQYRTSTGGHPAADTGWSLETEVAEAAGAAEDVGGLLTARYRTRVRPVLCLRDGEPMADQVGGTMVTSFMSLEHIVRASPLVLSTCEVAEVADSLTAGLVPVPAVPVPVRPGRRWVLSRKLFAGLARRSATAR